MDEDILHELDDVHIGTKMRGYDPVAVDDLLDRARREIEDVRTAARRAGERAELAERQLAEELDAARTARAEAEAGIATATAEAASLMAEARAEAADLRTAADAEIRESIQEGRARMLEQMVGLEAERDLVQEEIDVTAELVAAHRDRLLRAVEDLRTLVEGVEDRPAVVLEAQPEPTSMEPAVASPPAPVLEAGRSAEVVTRLHSVPPSIGGVGGDGEDLDAFFADDGS
jgi:DivIVA domain-containing protein